MRFRIICFLLAIGSSSFGQKIRFNSSIGSSFISWHEQQMTVDLGAQISYQKPTKNRKYFIALRSLGNVATSATDRSKYTTLFESSVQSQPLLESTFLNSSMRGGEAEAGVVWNTHPSKKNIHLTPVVSFFSRSIARRISSSKGEYLEEEKYRLHGLSAGLGVVIPGKTSLGVQAQLIQPFFSEASLFGQLIGVPVQSLSQEKTLNYRAKVQVSRGNFGLAIHVDVVNLGAAVNPNSRSILASQAVIPSSLFTYFF
jgi:hypothetical protein